MVISDEFTLNGRMGSDENMYLVTFDSEVLINKGIPFQRDISSVDGYSQLNPMFKDEDVPPDDVILNFLYMENDVPMEWTEDKIIKVKKWIVTDDFIPFITQDNPNYKYYLKCKKIQNRMTPSGLGVLECTFVPFSHFLYKSSYNKITITSQTNILITNPSIYNYNPVIIIKNLGDSSTINKIGEFEITGLDTNEIVTVDNLILSVINSNGINKFSNCNRKWLALVPGENELQVSGNCELEILCEFPTIL